MFFTTTFRWLSELAPLFESPGLNLLPLGLGAYLALYTGAWACLAGWMAGTHFKELRAPDPLAPFERPVLLRSFPNLGLAIFCSAVWCALEWIRGWMISGFGWNKMGVAMHRELPLIQIAEFTGVAGVSFLVVMCNAILLITVLRVRAEIGRIRLRPHFDFAITMALVVFAFGYGMRILVRAEMHPPESVALSVAAVQPNISQQDKFSVERWQSIFERMETLSDLAASTGPELLLWPEASVPGGMLSDADTLGFIRDRAALVPAMMIGTDDVDRGGPDEDHNSAAFLQRGHADPQFYDKRQLVPFGEYLPFRPVLGWLFGKLVPGDFKPGTDAGVFSLDQPAAETRASDLF